MQGSLEELARAVRAPLATLGYFNLSERVHSRQRTASNGRALDDLCILFRATATRACASLPLRFLPMALILLQWQVYPSALHASPCIRGADLPLWPPFVTSPPPHRHCTPCVELPASALSPPPPAILSLLLHLPVSFTSPFVFT